MSGIGSTFEEYLLSSIIVFIILFIIVSLVFTGKKLPETIRGFFLVIASFFYSPFIYFKNSLLTISNFSLKEQDENEKSKQYLLIKFLTSLQALLAIIVLFVITSGIIAAWEILLPPQYVRENKARLEKAIENLNDQYDVLNPGVQKMEKEWTENKDELINNYKKERDKKTVDAKNKNTAIEKGLTDKQEAKQYFNVIKNYLTQNETQTSQSRYLSIKNEINNYIQRQQTTEDIKTSLKNYSENWYLIMMNKYEDGRYVENDYRQKIQPNYASNKAQLENISNGIANTMKQEDKLRPQLKYNVDKFLLALLGTFATVLVLIWLVGLAIELLWLMVDVARGVNKIKILKEGDK